MTLPQIWLTLLPGDLVRVVPRGGVVPPGRGATGCTWQQAAPAVAKEARGRLRRGRAGARGEPAWHLPVAQALGGEGTLVLETSSSLKSFEIIIL